MVMVSKRRWPGHVLESLEREREREKFHLERQVEKNKIKERGTWWM
jgi:hypothetical protein